MHQRRGMEHLDDRPQPDAALAGTAERFGREKKKQWPNSLPAPRDQVPSDVGDDLDLGGRLPGEVLLDSGKIITQQIEDFRCGRDGERTHL